MFGAGLNVVAGAGGGGRLSFLSAQVNGTGGFSGASPPGWTVAGTSGTYQIGIPELAELGADIRAQGFTIIIQPAVADCWPDYNVSGTTVTVRTRRNDQGLVAKSFWISLVELK